MLSLQEVYPLVSLLNHVTIWDAYQKVMWDTYLSRFDRVLMKLIAAQPEPSTTTRGLAVNFPPLP